MDIKDIMKTETGDINYELFYDRGVKIYKSMKKIEKVLVNIDIIMLGIYTTLFSIVMCNVKGLGSVFKFSRTQDMYIIGRDDYYEERRLNREKLKL